MMNMIFANNISAQTCFWIIWIFVWMDNEGLLSESFGNLQSKNVFYSHCITNNHWERRVWHIYTGHFNRLFKINDGEKKEISHCTLRDLIKQCHSADSRLLKISKIFMTKSALQVFRYPGLDACLNTSWFPRSYSLSKGDEALSLKR